MHETLTLNPKTTALLCIDMQEEHRGDPRFLAENYNRVVENVRRLQSAARGNAIPVLHCAFVVDAKADGNRPFHPTRADGGSMFSDAADPLTAICPEVGPASDEPVFIKTRASAFAHPDLEPTLRRHGVNWLVVSGAWTEACVDASVRDAIDWGFRVLLVKDACGSGTTAMHQAGIVNLANRLYGGAVADTNGTCALLAGKPHNVWRIEGAVPFRYTLESLGGIYAAL